MRVRPSINVVTPNTNFIVHNVVIGDASGSMDGDKYRALQVGVKNELNLCEQLGYTFSFIEFVQSGKIITHYLKSDPKSVTLKFNGATGNNTPLYQTVYDTLNNLMFSKRENERFLIKVITDGQNNSGYVAALSCADKIKKAEKQGFTITFVAGEYDMKKIVKDLGLDESNVQTHKNTGESVEESFRGQLEATKRYDKRLKSGEDVTFGFYSKTLIS